MEIKPVNRFEKPKYPDQAEVRNNPECLKNVPERWKNNIYIAVAVSSLYLMTMTACGEKGNAGNGPGQTAAAGSMKGKNEASQAGVEDKLTAAPIFEHGGGRGSFGCMSIAPPAFLSEEEAYQVVNDEALKLGLKFERNTKRLEKIGIPKTLYYLKGETEDYKQDGGVIKDTHKGELVLDGYDETKKVGFEFISKDDYDTWSVLSSVQSSVEDFDFLSTAKVLREGIEGKPGDSTIGLLYNPMIKYDENMMKTLEKEKNWSEQEKIVKKIASEDLRKQVRDFLEWLKAEGII